MWGAHRTPRQAALCRRFRTRPPFETRMAPAQHAGQGCPALSRSGFKFDETGHISTPNLPATPACRCPEFDRTPCVLLSGKSTEAKIGGGGGASRHGHKVHQRADLTGSSANQGRDAWRVSGEGAGEHGCVTCIRVLMVSTGKSVTSTAVPAQPPAKSAMV